MARTLQQRNTGSEGRFATLRSKNVRCFDATEIALDPRVTVIIGENGAGKATVAEVIASVSYGTEEGLRHFPFRYGKPTCHIAVFDADRKTPTAVWHHGGKRPVHQRLQENRYLFAYGRYRRVYDLEAWDANCGHADVLAV
jgi:hypothetical protein